MSDSIEEAQADHIISSGLDLILPGLGLLFEVCIVGFDLSATQAQQTLNGTSGQTQAQQQTRQRSAGRSR